MLVSKRTFGYLTGTKTGVMNFTENKIYNEKSLKAIKFSNSFRGLNSIFN